MDFFRKLAANAEIATIKSEGWESSLYESSVVDAETEAQMKNVLEAWLAQDAERQLLEATKCPFTKAVHKLFDLDEERSGMVIVDTDEKEYRVRVSKDGVTVTSVNGTDERAKEIEKEILDAVGDDEDDEDDELKESNLSVLAAQMDNLIESIDETDRFDRVLSQVGDSVDSVGLRAAVDRVMEDHIKRNGSVLPLSTTVFGWATELGFQASDFQSFIGDIYK